MYDFFLKSYQNTPRERLLELMIDAVDIAELRQLDQSILASMLVLSSNVPFLPNRNVP